MAAYDYRCRTCGDTFEVRRAITDAAPAAVQCPAGHEAVARVWSAVAVGAGARSGGPEPVPAAGLSAGGGGCCGGGCCG